MNLPAIKIKNLSCYYQLKLNLSFMIYISFSNILIHGSFNKKKGKISRTNSSHDCKKDIFQKMSQYLVSSNELCVLFYFCRSIQCNSEYWPTKVLIPLSSHKDKDKDKNHVCRHLRIHKQCVWSIDCAN